MVRAFLAKWPNIEFGVYKKWQKASFINYFETLTNKKSPNTKSAWDNTLNHIINFHGHKLKFEDVTEPNLASIDFLSRL